MTLKALRSLVSHYDAKSAVITVLALGGARSSGWMLDFIGCSERALYDALRALVECGVIRKVEATEGSKAGGYELMATAENRSEVTAENRSRTLRKTAVKGTGGLRKTAVKNSEGGDGKAVQDVLFGQPAENEKPEKPAPVEVVVRERKVAPKKENSSLSTVKSVKSLKSLKQNRLTAMGVESPAAFRAEEQPGIPEGLVEIWGEYIAVRRARRFPVNQLWASRTCQRILGWVESYGIDGVRESIKFSTDNQYQGLFEERCMARKGPSGGIVGQKSANTRAQSAFERVLAAVGGSKT